MFDDKTGIEAWNGTGDRDAAGNVVEMSPFLTDQNYPELAEIGAYWYAKRGNRMMPARTDLDPRGIQGALSHCFILERIAPGLTRIRLAGQVFNDLMGMEVRGMPLTALFSAQDRDRLQDISEQVCKNPAIAQLSLSGERGLRKPALEARMTLWPLCDDAGRATRILGGLSFKGSIGGSQRRFQLASSRLKTLYGEDTLAPLPTDTPTTADFGTAQSKATEPQGFAEAPVPYLRLVKSDD